MTSAALEATTVSLAARRHRFAASLIDNLIFIIAVLPVSLLPDEEVGGAADESFVLTLLHPYAGDPHWPIEVGLSVLLGVSFWLQHTRWGRTPGKRLYGLKVVSSATGAPPGLRHAGVRAFVYPVLTMTPYLGVLIGLVDTLWMFADAKRRCLHDVLAGTVVVDLGGTGGKGYAGPGFLFGFGVIATLSTTIVLISALLGG